MDLRNMNRIPLNGTFELTARCNLQCKMCLIRIDNDAKSRMNEKNAKEWIDMARQVKQAGTLGLLLTGGEPLLRPDFPEIYSEIASMGFVLTVYTNATLITDEIYDMFRELPPHNIGVTVYGASGRTYGLVTGSTDAYERMLEGVDRLRRLPSRLTVRTTIIKDNLEDLDKISSWAKGLGPEVEFNVSRIVIMPVRGGIADVKAHRLSPTENVAMLKKLYTERIIEPLAEFFKENPDIGIGEELADIIKGREEEHNSRELEFECTIYGCEAGINSYTITWDGKLIGCQMLNDCCSYPFE
ncbi:MAG: radical SAM protein, partial [Clostridiales bacterium]|nr:radical SAM protein [Clostridiales bacterium]